MILLPTVSAIYVTKHDSEWLERGSRGCTSIVNVPEGTHILIIDTGKTQELYTIPSSFRHTKVEVLLPTNEVVYVAGDSSFWSKLLEKVSSDV